MEIERKDLGANVVVGLKGEINFDTSLTLRKTFLELIDEGKSSLVVNFKEVEYIDSSGLATLVELYQKLKGKNGTLRLSNLSGKVKSIFEITKLDKIFDIYDREEEALK